MHTLEPVKDPQLCSPQVLHAYADLNLALLLNPIHAEISPEALQLWAAEGEVVVKDWGKAGCFALTTEKQLPLPEWFTDVPTRMKVCVLFAELCAAEWAARAAEAAAEAGGRKINFKKLAAQAERGLNK